MKSFLEDFSSGYPVVPIHQLNTSFLNKKVVLTGWIIHQRDHGQICFLDVKDTTGFIQVFLDLDQAQKFKFSLQSVIAVKGTLLKRPEESQNTKIKTGLWELKVEDIQILSRAHPLPVDFEDDLVRDSLKLKYRYLFLRSKKIRKCLKLRARICDLVRQFFRESNFLEVETPILYKTTPEGARDYLVPSRIHKGKFYSLVQSPQILKQLLMIGGLGRYFQIAKCFRDEDLRSDRQPEFSQIDLEMSFVDMKEVMSVNEGLVKLLWKEIKGVNIPSLPILSYDEAIRDYGTDCPDLRNPLKLKRLTHLAEKTDVQIFKKQKLIKSLALPQPINRSFIDKLTKEVRSLGASGLLYLVDEGDSIKSSLKISQEELKLIYKEAQGKPRSVVLILAGEPTIVHRCFDYLMKECGKKLSLIDDSQDRLLWVVHFPLFEVDGSEIQSSHHPFTSVDMDENALMQKLDDIKKNPSLISDLNLRAQSYDLVCNGQEIAGGSIRNHNPVIQEKIFSVLGMGKEEISEKFGFFIDALKFGTPPHGGMAWGLDRLVMILSGTDDIRDVQAFPKTLQASCLMSSAPSAVHSKRLEDFGIVLKKGIE